MSFVKRFWKPLSVALVLLLAFAAYSLYSGKSPATHVLDKFTPGSLQHQHANAATLEAAKTLVAVQSAATAADLPQQTVHYMVLGKNQSVSCNDFGQSGGRMATGTPTGTSNLLVVWCPRSSALVINPAAYDKDPYRALGGSEVQAFTRAQASLNGTNFPATGVACYVGVITHWLAQKGTLAPANARALVDTLYHGAPTAQFVAQTGLNNGSCA